MLPLLQYLIRVKCSYCHIYVYARIPTPSENVAILLSCINNEQLVIRRWNFDFSHVLRHFGPKSFNIQGAQRVNQLYNLSLRV